MVTVRTVLRGFGVGELALIAYALLYMGLSPFAAAAVLLLGGGGAILAIMFKQVTVKLTGLAMGGAAIFALVALPNIAFIPFVLIAIFVALFGGA